MTGFTPFAIALRLSGVSISQAALEAEIGRQLSRFEPEDADSGHYAQVDLDETKAVRAILELAEQVGPKIAALLDSRSIGKAVLDIAFDFPEDGEAMSTRLPAHMAAAVAVHDIDIEVSVYLTDVEEADD